MISWWNEIEFAHPEFFWLLLLIPIFVVFYILKRNKLSGHIKISNLSALQTKGSYLPALRYVLFGLRMIALALLITAMARPQSSLSWQNVSTEGIDIVLSLDISGSMLAKDFEPNRLQAAKEVAMEFISERPNDRIGLVVYSGESFTQCPLTTDHDVLKNLFGDIKNGMIEDGTAIGMGLATAVDRLRESDAKSKVVILLTDGENNRGFIAPETAAEIAREFGVRVYTIGVGTNGMAPFPVQTAFGTKYRKMPVKIDEATLKNIAKMTDGRYFRATDNDELRKIYDEIDRLEKSKIEVTEYKKKAERFFPLALVAGIILLGDYLTRNTLLRSVV